MNIGKVFLIREVEVHGTNIGEPVREVETLPKEEPKPYEVPQETPPVEEPVPA